MAGGAPGGNSRGRGGKFKKYTRGGGKHFSRDLRPVDSEGNEISMWAAGAKEKGSANASSDEEEEDDDDEDDEEDDSAAEDKGPVSREERKKLAKARKDAAIAKKKAQAVEVGDMPPSDSDEEESDDDDDDMPANPNHSKAARNQTKAATAKSGDAGVDDVTDGVKGLSAGGAANRKERESAEALVAKEKYRRLHEAGKTDEAKADMARLKLIREQREAEGARRAAEKEERDAQEAARKTEIDAKEAKKREAALGKKTSKKAK